MKTWLNLMMTVEDYKGCTNLKPCQDIVYTVAEKLFQKPGGIEIQFQNKLVEVLTDSYSYSTLSLFAELGGVIGMLLGLSVIGSIEKLINGLQQYTWQTQNLWTTKNKNSNHDTSRPFKHHHFPNISKAFWI